MSKKIELLELDISTESLIKKGAEAQKELERLKKEADFFKKAIKEGNSTIEKYTDKLTLMEKQGKKNTSEYNSLKKNLETFSKSQDKNRERLELVNDALSKQNDIYKRSKRTIKDFTKTVEDELGIVTKTDGSIDQLNRALDINRNIYRKLTKEQRENVAIGGQLFKTISDQDKEYKELQVSIGTTQVLVGDYKSQINKLIKENLNLSKTFKGQIEKIPFVGVLLSSLYDLLIKYAAGQRAAIKATKGSAKALKIFKLALISTGIGLIVVALASLIAYFQSTQKGIDAVSSVLTPLKIVFESLLGVLQNVGKTMADAFTSPKKSIKALWQSIKTNLINRVTSIGGIFKALGKIISSGFKDGYKDLANSSLQAVTGIENVIDKTQAAAKNTSKFFDEAWKRGKKIDELQKKLNKSEADYILNLAKAKEEFKAQNKIAEDQTKSLAVREAAAKKTIELQKDINKLEDDRLSTEIELMKLKQQSNDTLDSDRAELAQLEANRKASRERQLEAETTQQNKLNAIRKEAVNKAIALNKKRVDAVIKESKTLIDLYIAEQGVKAKTLKQELAIAEKVSKKRKKVLKAELKANKITQLEYNLAILKLDNDLIAKRAELVIDNAQRELEIFKDSHQAKLDANTFFTEELLNQETARLDAIANKELEYHQKRLEQGVINQTEYNDAINTVNKENRIKKEEAQVLRDEALKEKQIIDLENQRIIDEERFNNSYEIHLSRLKQSYESEKKSAIKTGADTTLITQKYEISKAKIQNAQRETKLNADGQAFGQIADFIGRESELGKAAALAQAGINIQLGITKALASKGFAGIVEGVLIAAKGAVSIGKITSTKPPKAEHGAVFNIGGKRHHSGGTKFAGDDGTEFEAEEGEKMFILNRQASAALGPLLSDINQQYGGVSLSTSSSYLASGGEVLRNTVTPSNSNTKINYDLLADKIGMRVGEANLQLPAPIVKPSEIMDVYNENQAVIDGSNG